MHRRRNLICVAVRAERAHGTGAIDTSNVNTCRLDIFLRYDAGQRIHHHARSRTVAAMVTQRHTRREHRSISHYLPLTRTPHASPICMTISPSAMAECKRILAIHIYRSALLPALVTAFVQFVRFQHRPLPSTFCSTSTYGHTHIHAHAHVHSLSLFLLLSLPFSLLNSTAISRIYLPVSASPFRPFFADSSPLRPARIVVFVALVGVVAKVRWSGGERAKERRRYRILCPA